LAGLKNGCTLVTYTDEEPIPTDLVICATGLITGSYNSLSLPISISLIILSSVCLHHLTGLSRVSSEVFPGPP
tara:strand:- start:3320 stop:3538 length:219 start_codon:yes stop_codon:yes gene_type:complete